jgi:glycosyltransferase involved in cell wall biosynthesis
MAATPPPLIRVAWKVPYARDWIGGFNYFKNLLEALLVLPDRRVEPVLLGGGDLPPPFDRCPSLPCPYEKGLTLRRCRDLIGRYGLHDGGTIARFLQSQNIRLLSHDCWLGARSPVPALCWIPDFQHLHLPRFFTRGELRRRRLHLSLTARRAQAVLLSSQDARRDFIRLYPHQAHKAHVLHFVAQSPAEEALPDTRSVLGRYGIAEPFFHLPNQLWAHKNHVLVLAALALLAEQGRAPLVVSTGYTDDPRNPGFFRDLCARRDRAGLAERCRFLGLIPQAEAIVLMRQAVAVINPSLFEGWSTTVEEAKSLGKRLLLSDLAVHREQASERADYFPPHDPARLAALMRQILADHDPQAERAAAQRAREALPERIRRYGLGYEDLVLDVLSRRGDAVP